MVQSLNCVLCGEILPLGTPIPSGASGAACASCKARAEAELDAQLPDVPVRFTQPERGILASYAVKLRAARPELASVPTRALVRLLAVEQAATLLGMAEDSPQLAAMRQMILATSCCKCGATLRLERVSEVQRCRECGANNLPPRQEGAGA